MDEATIELISKQLGKIDVIEARQQAETESHRVFRDTINKKLDDLAIEYREARNYADGIMQKLMQPCFKKDDCLGGIKKDIIWIRRVQVGVGSILLGVGGFLLKDLWIKR